jgi:hypothetical protein
MRAAARAGQVDRVVGTEAATSVRGGRDDPEPPDEPADRERSRAGRLSAELKGPARVATRHE